MNRNGFVSLLVATAFATAAVIVVWSYLHGNSNDYIKAGPAISTGSESASAQGGTGGNGQGTAPPDEEKQSVQCAGPLPERSRVQYTRLPEGKLGKWLAIKNDSGKESLRFRVDLLDAAEIGDVRVGQLKVPIVSALFRISVQNLSCQQFVWPVARGGLWVSWREAHPRDVGYAWIASSEKSGSTILLQQHGRFNDDSQDFHKLLLQQKFGKTALKELPDRLKPGERGEVEVVVTFRDPYRQTGYAPVGLHGDGRIHFALGGELAWAVIDVGKVEDWIK